MNGQAMPPDPADRLRRRRLLGAGAAAVLGALPGLKAAAHSSYGPLSPAEPVATVRLSTADGKAGPALLKDLLLGHITAVQLMFTGCSATCPIQGAIFADAQARLVHGSAELRLLSISIDPLGDDAAALRRWLVRFGAQHGRWSAAVPRVQDVDTLIDHLRGRAVGADRHTAQAFLFDRRARLAFRTADLPPGGELVRVMHELAALR